MKQMDLFLNTILQIIFYEKVPAKIYLKEVAWVLTKNKQIPV